MSSMSRPLAPTSSYYPAATIRMPDEMEVAEENPLNMAVAGSVLGNLLGHAVGYAGTRALLKPPAKVQEVVVTDATEEQAISTVNETYEEAMKQLAAWNRKRHAITGVAATVFSAIGAYIGARGGAHQGRAALGSAIGTGAVKATNYAANPPIGAPGLVTGGLGAYFGARGGSRVGTL